MKTLNNIKMLPQGSPDGWILLVVFEDPETGKPRWMQYPILGVETVPTNEHGERGDMVGDLSHEDAAEHRFLVIDHLQPARISTIGLPPGSFAQVCTIKDAVAVSHQMEESFSIAVDRHDLGDPPDFGSIKDLLESESPCCRGLSERAGADMEKIRAGDRERKAELLERQRKFKAKFKAKLQAKAEEAETSPPAE